jgi:transcriptional regulator with XRE-family HTH domain
MHPGLRLRQARERLGLTYREVERASYELAARRGRSEFILHISRLAEIENRGVVPGLHKLYSLAAIYHLSPQDILRWNDVPLEDCFHDGGAVQSPQTHLLAPPTSLRIPMRFDPGSIHGARSSCREWSKGGGTLRACSRTVAATMCMGILACRTGAWCPCCAQGVSSWWTPRSGRSMMATGRRSTTGPCTLWKFAMVTAADGFIRTVRGW